MNSLAEVISFTHVFCCTIFKLLAHYCACWCGHVVSGVLLRIGWRDDGHQVVSVRGVYLEINTKMLTQQKLSFWPTTQTNYKETKTSSQTLSWSLFFFHQVLGGQNQFLLETKGAFPLGPFLLCSCTVVSPPLSPNVSHQQIVLLCPTP